MNVLIGNLDLFLAIGFCAQNIFYGVRKFYRWKHRND